LKLLNRRPSSDFQILEVFDGFSFPMPETKTVNVPSFSYYITKLYNKVVLN